MRGAAGAYRKGAVSDPQNNQIQKGGIIADGVDLELDDLRRIACHGKDVIAEIQRRESEATGIPSLKVSFNNVFGYYIEVRNTHKDKVPADWIRKQTLTSAERYITQELKSMRRRYSVPRRRWLAIEQRIYAGWWSSSPVPSRRFSGMRQCWRGPTACVRSPSWRPNGGIAGRNSPRTR